MGNIKFEKVLKQMASVKDKKLSKLKFQEWLNENVIVKEYLTIIEKYSLIKAFCMDFEHKYMNRLISNELNVGSDFFYLGYDILSLFELLLFYTNIEIDDGSKTSDNYDLIYTTGLYDYILLKCKDDYLSLREKCDKVVGVNDFTIISKFNKLIEDNLIIDDFNKSIKDIKSILKDKDVSENLKFINNIEALNNPYINNIVNKSQI